jgi:hypothetical protein
MVLMANSLRNGILAAAIAGLALGGCGANGVDVEVNAPILNAVGLNLSSKPKAEEDLPERTGLVMPPSTASLPQPGERTAATQNWPVDPDLQRKQKADAEAAAREKYCREGEWGDKANIEEFEKNAGRQERCGSKFGEAVSKALGGGPATAR